jgi:hypothetical protein
MSKASQEFVVEELDQLYGITEEELASTSIVCTTCTCTGASEAETPAEVSPST